MRYVFAIALLFAAHASAADPVAIQLKDIWAYEMPGTKDVRDLDPDSYGRVEGASTIQERADRFKNSLVQEILQTLDFLPAKRTHEPLPAFVVEGTGTKSARRRSERASGQDSRSENLSARERS